MAKSEEATIIKKYANRRLYNTGTSTYVTLEDLAEMVKDGEDFVVFDAKTGEDITHSVLTQIIFEQETKGHNLLPISFLRQLIRFYGDSMQNLVPSYLDFSISSLSREQDRFRNQMGSAFGTTAFDAIEDQVRRNTEMFERAMRMFLPFGTTGQTPAEPAARSEPDPKPAAAAPSSAAAPAADLDDLKRQLSEMQRQIAAIAGVKKPDEG